MFDKEKLRYWALELEKEMELHKNLVICGAPLSEHQFIIDAIQDAKKGLIYKPSERLGNLKWFYDDLDHYKFPSLGDALASFSLLLKGHKLAIDIDESPTSKNDGANK